MLKCILWFSHFSALIAFLYCFGLGLSFVPIDFHENGLAKSDNGTEFRNRLNKAGMGSNTTVLHHINR